MAVAWAEECIVSLSVDAVLVETRCYAVPNQSKMLTAVVTEVTHVRRGVSRVDRVLPGSRIGEGERGGGLRTSRRASNDTASPRRRM